MNGRDESSWWDRAVISGHDGGQGVPWAGMGVTAGAAVTASAEEVASQPQSDDDPAAAVLLSDGELLSRLEF